MQKNTEKILYTWNRGELREYINHFSPMDVVTDGTSRPVLNQKFWDEVAG